MLYNKAVTGVRITVLAMAILLVISPKALAQIGGDIGMTSAELRRSAGAPVRIEQQNGLTMYIYNGRSNTNYSYSLRGDRVIMKMSLTTYTNRQDAVGDMSHMISTYRSQGYPVTEISSGVYSVSQGRNNLMLVFRQSSGGGYEVITSKGSAR